METEYAKGDMWPWLKDGLQIFQQYRNHSRSSVSEGQTFFHALWLWNDVDSSFPDTMIGLVFYFNNSHNNMADLSVNFKVKIRLNNFIFDDLIESYKFLCIIFFNTNESNPAFSCIM